MAWLDLPMRPLLGKNTVKRLERMFIANFLFREAVKGWQMFHQQINLLRKNRARAISNLPK